MKENKKGFISSSAIYSFFIVTVLLMTATLMTYTVKQKLALKIQEEIEEPETKECSTTILSNGVTYILNGEEVSEYEYCGSCQCPCKIMCNVYYDKLGNSVSLDEYNSSCSAGYVKTFNNDGTYSNPINASIREDQYFAMNGAEIDYIDYLEECENKTCEIVNYKNKKYYFYEGKSVTETTYNTNCKNPPTNQPTDGSDEIIVGPQPPEPSCKNTCEEKNGKYYYKCGETSYDKYCETCECSEQGGGSGGICLRGDSFESCMLKNYAINNSRQNEDINVNIFNVSTIKQSIQSINNNELSTPATNDTNEIRKKDSLYFFRGNVNYNWVEYAGLSWRVVNFDNNNVKLILDEYGNNENNALVKTKYTDTTDTIIFWQVDEAKKRLVGLMNGAMHNGEKDTENDTCKIKINYVCTKKTEKLEICYKWEKQTTYYNASGKITDATTYAAQCNTSSMLPYNRIYNNKNNSTILKSLYSFYQNKLTSDTDLINTNYIFCADKNEVNLETEHKSKLCALQYTNDFFKTVCSNTDILSYASADISFYSGMNRAMKSTPSILCQNTGDAALIKSSAYKSLSKYSIANTQDGSGNLDYSIGLLTVDEAILAGLNLSYKLTNEQINNVNENNTVSNYLLDSNNKSNSYLKKNYSFWLSTPAFVDKNITLNKGIYNSIIQNDNIDKNDYDKKGIYYFIVNEDGRIKVSETNDENIVRPVINLKSNNLIICSENEENGHTIYTLANDVNKCSN